MNKLFLVLSIIVSSNGVQYLSASASMSEIDQDICSWFKAVADGDIKLVRWLSKIIIVNVKDEQGNTALISAVAAKQKEIVTFLLKLPRININAQNKDGNTALISAILTGQEDIVRILIEYTDTDSKKIVNANTKNNSRDTALTLATNLGQENVVKMLLKIPDIEVNAKNKLGETALILAANNGHENIMKLLLSVPDINVNALTTFGQSALVYAVYQGHENIVKLLLQVPGIDVNIQTFNGNTALLYAAYKEHENILKLLLAIPGIEVNTRGFKEHTPLMIATIKGRKNIVKLLLDAPGININAQDDSAKTAYQIAEKWNLEFVAELIKNKIDEKVRAGFQAIENGNLEALKAVVSQIGNKETDDSGNTFLHAAFAKNSAPIISFLLQNSQDPRKLLDIRNNSGLISFDLIAPTSPIFKYFIDLLDQCAKEKSRVSKKRKKMDAPVDEPVDTLDKSCAYCAKADCTEYCSRCKAVYYCCIECQKSHWKTHKLSCSSLKKQKLGGLL